VDHRGAAHEMFDTDVASRALGTGVGVRRRWPGGRASGEPALRRLIAPAGPPQLLPGDTLANPGGGSVAADTRLT